MAIIHHWDLQETSGTTVTDSVGSNNGTIDGSVTLGATGPGGSLIKAADFSGTSQNPIALDSSVVLPAAGDWSFSIWVQTDVADAHGMLFGDTSNTDDHFWLWSGSTKLQFRDNNNTGMNGTGLTSSVGVMRLHTVTNVGSTKVTEHRIDDVVESTGTVNNNVSITHIGNGYSSTLYGINGKLSDFRIYDSILSTSDIDALIALGTDGVTIGNIQDDQFYQRPTSGNLSLAVSGTSASDEVIEYQIDSGTWQTLVTAVSGVYSGTANVSAGNHTINVRLSSDAATTATVDIHVGDAFGWFGQSNPDGRLTNSQPYSGSLGFWIYDQDDAWIVGTSGYKSPATSLYSVLPRLASLIEASTGVPVAFVCETKGGTGVTVGPWDSNPAGAQYLAAVATINDSGINYLRAVLFDAGENDAIDAGVTAALMQSTLEEMHDDMQVATGLTFPLILAQTGTTTGALAGKLDEVRLGQQAAVDNNSDIYFGAVGYDRSGLHWVSDTEAATYASRYAIAVDAALFGSATGTPPRLVTAVVNGTTVTLTYDRDLEAAPAAYTANAWTFDDDGSAIVVTTAIKAGTRAVDLTLVSSPVTTNLTLAFAYDNAAQGDDVPRELGGQPALPRVAPATSDAHAPVWEVLSVEQMQRVISIS